MEKDIRTRVYPAQARHRNFPELLNVAVIVKTHLKTGRSAKVLLFSDDLALAAGTLIEYYALRFQIEFDFRRQGNAGRHDANFSLFMVAFSRRLCDKMESLSGGGMLDLKTTLRARKCTRRILNSLGKTGEEFLIDGRIFQAADIGRTHAKAA